MHGVHRRGFDLAETRDDLELRLAARGIKLIYASEQPDPKLRTRRAAARWATIAGVLLAAVACPPWAAGSVIAVLVALAVVHEVPA